MGWSLTPKRCGLVGVLALTLVGLAPVAAAAGPVVPTTAATHATASTVSDEARALADAAGMSAKGRAVYLANDPTVDERAEFAADCPRPESPDSYLLGCYTSTPGRIHVLRLDRPELASGMTVTAAHEMLHAVHHQLAARKLAELEPLLEWAYGATDDPKLHQEVDSYPPRQRLDEMYARLGTEVATLPPRLEQHYDLYFADRSRVVSAAAAYRQVFDDLEAQLTRIDAQIADMERQGDDLRAQFDAAGAEADRLGAQIDSLRAQGRIAESNALVDPANAAEHQADALADAYNGLVDRHNALVESYDELALTDQQLVDSLKPWPTT